MLDRDAILGADDLVTEVVEVPQWGGSVCIRSMTGTERDEFEQEMLALGAGERSVENIRARLLVRVIVDEDGSPLFTPADVSVLGAKSASALDMLFDVAQRLNALRPEDVEELAKA